MIAPFGHERFRIEPIQFIKPFSCVGNERFQQNTLINTPDARPITFEAKLLWQANGLATSIAKQLGDSGFGVKSP